jgi:hypothetical protein
MKKYSSIILILSLACACLISVGCTTGPGAAMAPPPNSGHVLIYRVANFGSNLSLVVSVDGNDADRTSWEDLLLHRSLVARRGESKIGQKPVSDASTIFLL